MELSEKDRLLIANQLRILEALYPDEADYYAVQRKAVEQGYTLHYSDLTAGFFDEMSPERCQEILDILEMYRVLTFSATELDDLEINQHHSLRFEGFDGNHETSEMLYAQYFVEDLDRYNELKYGSEYASFNSHTPLLDKYRRMLSVWRSLQKRSYELSRDEVLAVLEA